MYFFSSHTRHLWATKRVPYLDSTVTRLHLLSVSGEDDWRPLPTKEGSFVTECNGTSFPIPPALSQPKGLFRRRFEMCVAFFCATH